MNNKNEPTSDILTAKNNINNSLVSCICSINDILENLHCNYSPHLIQLISVLKDTQNNNVLLNCEGKALGNFLKAKGYTKEEASTVVQYVMNCFD